MTSKESSRKTMEGQTELTIPESLSATLLEINKEIKDMKSIMLVGDEIQKYVNTAVESSTNKVILEIKTKIKKEIACEIEQQVSIQIEDKMKKTNTEIDELHKRLNQQITEIDTLKERCEQVEGISYYASSSANWNEQYSRKSNVRVLNLKPIQGQQLRDTFINLVRIKTGCLVEGRDILAIHQLSVREPTHTTVPPILIIFVNNMLKSFIMSNRNAINNGTGIRIFDDLTNTSKKCPRPQWNCVSMVQELFGLWEVRE